MIALILFVIQVLFSGMNNVQEQQVVIIPPMPMYLPDSFSSEMDEELAEELDWVIFESLAAMDYRDEFDAIFNAIEYKVSKNGRSMVKGINDKSFKFVKKG